MGLKTNIALGLMATGGLVLGGGSAAYLYLSQEAKQVENTLDAFDLTRVADRATADGESAIALAPLMDGGNTALLWEVAKNKPSGARMEFDGTWSSFTGGLVYDTDAKALLALEVVIQANSISGHGAEHPAPGTLIRTITGQLAPAPAWFALEAHPTATYTATQFIPRADVAEDTTVFDNAPEGWTHLVQGTFTLNGVEAALDIPARVAFTGDNVVVNLGFQVDRQAHNIDGAAVGGWTVEDIIYLTATVESAPAGDIINQTLLAYGEKIGEQQTEIARLSAFENQIEELNSQVATLREALASGAVAGGPDAAASYDVSDLPERFTDHIVYPIMKPQSFPKRVADLLGFTITYPDKSPMAFDMVLVPGDADAGVAPFYMAEHELTWRLFHTWAYANDIYVNEQAELEQQDLRPSPLYQDCDQLKIGLGNRPALSMSRRTAEAFCKWLSEETGRRYRLPTDTEWHLALELGGGIPSDQASFLSQATMLDNAESQARESEAADQFDPFADDGAEEQPPLVFSTLVGSREPNALGIYDLIGNAAEWVTDTGAERYVRGGHFRLSIAEFNIDWKSVEDQDIWNETYPQKPNSRFWYRDHYYQGIRLVCDPVNLPE